MSRELGLPSLLTNGPAAEVIANDRCTGALVPRLADSSRRIRAEHGIAHLKNRRTLARHLGRRERMDDTGSPTPSASHG